MRRAVVFCGRRGGAPCNGKGGVMSDLVKWPADVDEVIQGDLTAAVAYCTPAGGAVVIAVAPVRHRQREAGVLRFTTSLGFGKKLDRIIRDPHVALAYHTRSTGLLGQPASCWLRGQPR